MISVLFRRTEAFLLLIAFEVGLVFEINLDGNGCDDVLANFTM